MHKTLLAATALACIAAGTAHADLVVSMNDNHTTLDAKGNLVAADPVKPDNIDLIDVDSYPPRIVASLEAPGSVVGPPLAVWVAKDESWAITTANTKADPNGKFGISPDNRVSVIDLTSKPPRVMQTVEAGLGPAMVRVSPDGTLALVANRNDGTVSVFTVADKHLTPAGVVDLGNKNSGPGGLVFLPDGKSALVTRYFDNMVSLLHIDGTHVTVDPRPITAGIAPYTMDINAAGTLVAVSNMGRGDGDEDVLSLIDVAQNPPRTVAQTGVVSGPEPMKFSPDGQFVAVGAENGTGLAQSSRFYNPHGLVQIFAVKDAHLSLVTTAPVGRWVEGIAWSRDGKTLLVQNALEKSIAVFRFDGTTLTPGTPLQPTGGPVSFGTAWP
jgi:DNA-binding beta-propeller fold protein YncE